MDHYLAKKFPLILIYEHKKLCAGIRDIKIKSINLLTIKVGAEFSLKMNQQKPPSKLDGLRKYKLN